MTHTEKAKAVLLRAVREATKGMSAVSGPMIRNRVETCLSTALTICKEDATEMYRLIDDAREQPKRSA